MHVHVVLIQVHVIMCVCIFQTTELPAVAEVKDAAVLLFLGDSVTTDHISPAGSIARNSPAARYLAGKGCVYTCSTCMCIGIVIEHSCWNEIMVAAMCSVHIL